MTADNPSNDEVLGQFRTLSERLDATWGDVIGVDAIITFDLAGQGVAPGAPVCLGEGWVVAVTGQVDPSVNGIYVGRTPDPMTEGTWLPAEKLRDLPVRNGIVFSNGLSTDLSSTIFPAIGSYVQGYINETPYWIYNAA